VAGPIAGPIILICALAGLTYSVAIGVWLRTGSGPEGVHWSDFWWYGVGPAAIYLGMTIAAGAVWAGASRAPSWVAIVLLALLLMGIRNAWDLVTWLAPRRTGG
jgi:hypothetical protein